MRHLTPAFPAPRLFAALCVGLTSLVVPQVSVSQTFTSDVTVTTHDGPAVFLSQTDVGAQPAYSWSMEADHVFFGVKDVTQSTQIAFPVFPFIIQANAPGQSLNIAPSGHVGVGIVPSRRLHVFQDVNANSFILMQNPNTGTTAAAVIRTQSDAATLNFQAHAAARTISRFGQTLGGWNEMLSVTGNGFAIGTFNDTPLVLGANSQMRVRVTNVGVEVFGTLTNSSSRDYKEAIRSLDATEAMTALAGLQPVKFRYREQTKENLGFIAEDVPALVAMDGRKSIAPMDLIALLTKVVQEQQKTIDAQRDSIDALRQEQQQALSAQRASIDALRLEQQQTLAALGEKVAHLEPR
jgi:Chaperone of endosialidase